MDHQQDGEHVRREGDYFQVSGYKKSEKLVERVMLVMLREEERGRKGKEREVGERIA